MQQKDTSIPKVEMRLHLLCLSCRSPKSLGAGALDSALFRPLLQTPRYYQDTLAEQPTVTSSITGDETFQPFRLQITNCQADLMIPSNTVTKNTIEMLINSNQYQVLYLKWVTGGKMAELRFSSKYWGYNGKTTGLKISFVFKSRTAGLMLRGTGTTGSQPEPAGEEKGIWFPLLPTQIIFIKLNLTWSFPICTLKTTHNHHVRTGMHLLSLCHRHPHSMFPGQHLLLLITLPKPWKTRKYAAPG